MIKVSGLVKSFTQGKNITEVLKDVDLKIEEGEFVAIMGPSGSGKSTLLQLLGGLDSPTNGKIEVGGKAISEMSENQRTIFRRKNIGIIFQNYQLLNNLTVEENIAFPLYADGTLDKEKMKEVKELIQAVGLNELNKKQANLLSGGQQQRVAIARSLVNQPNVLLADEPTGNLDRSKAEEILLLLTQFHKKNNQTIIMVTHDIFAAGFADKIILFKDGTIEQIISREDENYAQYLANFMA
ncbi:ABC transporter ATP-binding protein [Oceanobacillus sp. FSL W8-0428]|uniref:Macrolide ABC transporter ATP-binding protein n=1 Tax=Oceanobacillus sojae TaxID=582851 RepID=A0A511ZHA2_9BACI|nr:ABC transporter ATP-binding protein [Oceanobacillus sojae]GEN86823.1 macrolide ABC transporter ATP-binding protein [Oceanobacillus sojae]